MRIKPVLFAFFIASLGFSGEAGAQFPSFADLAEKLTRAWSIFPASVKTKRKTAKGTRPCRNLSVPVLS